MRISSIKKTSLIDYPGKISAVIGTQGCNLHCPWCHNFHLIPHSRPKGTETVRANDFLLFLAERKNLLEGVVITGGEPTIQSDLPDFCGELKEMGYSVKLDTNGTNPTVLQLLFDKNLVDYIALDIKTDFPQYRQLSGNINFQAEIVESIKATMSAGKEYEFRTTCVEPFVDQNNIENIAAMIKGARRWYLQKCNPTDHFPDRKNTTFLDNETLHELKQKAIKHVPTCEVR